MAQMMAATTNIKAGYGLKQVQVHASYKGRRWRRFNDGENDSVHESESMSAWEAWKEWQREPPQRTDFPT
jgi:hypothetical protein